MCRKIGIPDLYVNRSFVFCNMFEYIANADTYFQGRAECSTRYFAYHNVMINYIISSSGYTLIKHFKCNKFSF